MGNGNEEIEMGNGNEEIEMKKWGIFKQKHQVEVVFLLVYIYIYNIYIFLGLYMNLQPSAQTFASSKMTAVLGSDKTRNKGNGNEETKMRK